MDNLIYKLNFERISQQQLLFDTTRYRAVKRFEKGGGGT